MRKQYHIHLTSEQRAEAEGILRRGQASALTHRHARILLAAEAGPDRRVRSDTQVAQVCGVSARTVARVRECFATHGLAVALHGRPHPGARPTLDAAQEARLIALACSPAPPGYDRWTVRLLAERVVELTGLPLISRELVRTTLKKTASSRGASGAG
jgi:transposase